MLTEKQQLILLTLLEENKETDPSKLTNKCKENGIDTHINYVRNVMKDLSEEYVDLREHSFGNRVFYKVEPRHDRETFEKLLKIFFRSDYSLDFHVSDYSQQMINEDFIEYYLTEFWNLVNSWDTEPKIKIKESIVDIIETMDKRGAQKSEGIESIIGTVRESPLALHTLMFPEETAKEVFDIFLKAMKLYDDLAKAIGVQGEELLKMFTEVITKPLKEESERLESSEEKVVKSKTQKTD